MESNTYGSIRTIPSADRRLGRISATRRTGFKSWKDRCALRERPICQLTEYPPPLDGGPLVPISAFVTLSSRTSVLRCIRRVWIGCGLSPTGACVQDICVGSQVANPRVRDSTETHIGGATLDVFEREPLPAGDPLWTMPNVLITPHLASVAIPSSAAQQIAENIIRVSRDESPENIIDRARGY